MGNTAECVKCGEPFCVIEIMYVDLDGVPHVGWYCQQHADELQAGFLADEVKVKSWSVSVHASPRRRPLAPEAPENPIAWLIRRLTNARP